MVIELYIEFGLTLAFNGCFTFCVVQIIVGRNLSSSGGEISYYEHCVYSGVTSSSVSETLNS